VGAHSFIRNHKMVLLLTSYLRLFDSIFETSSEFFVSEKDAATAICQDQNHVYMNMCVPRKY